MPKILLAEDDEALRTLYARMLEDAGHGVTLAENGRRALELLPESSPDLILLDFEMPELQLFVPTAQRVLGRESCVRNWISREAFVIFTMKISLLFLICCKITFEIHVFSL